MANEIKLTFAGDSKSLDRTFANVEKGARDVGDGLDEATVEAGKFTKGIGGMNEKIGNAESKFMGTADLVDGLAAAFGVSLGPTVEYARAFGDMAGGFTATLGPAMESISGKLGKLSIVTKAQTAAQAAMNAVMSANPIFLVVAALAALAVGFVIAYKKSETFRNIVNSIGDGIVDIAKKLGSLAEIMITPYRIAFQAIASMWNRTIGALEVNIPGFLGFGGIKFGVPDIPTFAAGGIAHAGQPAIVGDRGRPEMFVPHGTGTIKPSVGNTGGGVQVMISTGASDLDDLIRKRVRVLAGGNVQKAFGQ